jgi:glycerophosphoryl diester phosphodiesterase
MYVTPWTLRADALPPGADSYGEVFDLLARDALVDAVITDFPDLAEACRTAS